MSGFFDDAIDSGEIGFTSEEQKRRYRETHPLTFGLFQDANALRSKEAFAGSHEWGVSEIALAIAGEAGELCNIVKKINRGDFTLDEKRLEVLKEAADTITYCDKLITKLGARTDEVLRQKFNEVNERVGWKGNL